MADDPFKFGAGEAGKDEFSPPGEGELSPGEGAGGPHSLGALKNLMTGNWLLVGLFGAGLAFLYAMNLMKGPSPASAQQIQAQSSVEEALAKLSVSGAAPAAGKTTKAIVETFYCEAKHRQIPAEAIKSNPFVFRAVAPPLPQAAVVEPTASTKPAASNAAAEALDAVKALKLSSVLMGAKPAAIISDNLLTEGQSIHGWTVNKILAREVQLSWKDQTYVLRMSE
jgi:hypothetical protein